MDYRSSDVTKIEILEMGDVNNKNQSVKNSINKETIHDSIIRKSIKEQAKKAKKSPLILIPLLTLLSLFSLIILFAISVNTRLLVVADVFGLILFISIPLYIIFWFFVSFGMIKASLEISRGNCIKCTTLIKNSFKNPSWCIKYFFIIIIFNIILCFLTYFSSYSFLLLIIIEIYFMPVIIMFSYIASDEKVTDKTIFGMIKRANHLVKDHRVEFYGLLISLIDRLLVVILTLGIALFWVIPYINITLANFYRYLNGENLYNGDVSIKIKKGLSNDAIVIITMVLYCAFIMILIFWFIPHIDSLIAVEYDELVNRYN